MESRSTETKYPGLGKLLNTHKARVWIFNINDCADDITNWCFAIIISAGSLLELALLPGTCLAPGSSSLVVKS